jgi:hypothetical protein
MLRYRNKQKTERRPKSLQRSTLQGGKTRYGDEIGSLVILGPFLFALLAMYLGLVATNKFLEYRSAARVGDILEIPVQVAVVSNIGPIPARRLATPWAPPGRACSLDVRSIGRYGGSATVLAVRPDGVMLEWAGQPRALGNGDCETQQPILIKNTDYRELFSLKA